MGEHQTAPCRRPKDHAWTKWEDKAVSWLYVPLHGTPIRLRRQGQQRRCTRCDKKEVQVTDVFTAESESVSAEVSSGR